jgi:hypothetical protein
MSHPFETGKTYRNRVGEYVVQSIEGDKMTIRYVNGGTLVTDVTIQARIWENIQFEEQMSREEERMRLAREARMKVRRQAARAKRAKAIPKFPGFQESDFEPKKRGIAWSSRKELGKVLAHKLNQEKEKSFDSWIVPRKSEVHVARKDHYDMDERELNAAFFVAVDDRGVSHGFRVGKPDGKAKVKWPWSAFLKAITEDDKLRRAMRAAMKAHELTLDVYAMDVSYGMVGRVSLQPRGFLWEEKKADQELTQRMQWTDLVDHLQEVGASKRCNLYLRRLTPADEASNAGRGAADEIAAVFEALLLVYDTSVGA